MRYVIALLLLVSQVSFGLVTKKINAASTNIASAYSISAPQLAITAIPTTSKSIVIYNDTAERIAVNIKHPSATYAPTADVSDIYVAAGTGIALDNVGVSKQVFLRGDGADIATGHVLFVVW